MPMRQFQDVSGRQWLVWDVHPTLVERRGRDTGPPPGILERRRRIATRTVVSRRMAQGWLAFVANDGERRRFAPIPESPIHWSAASQEELCAWCCTAERIEVSPSRESTPSELP